MRMWCVDLLIGTVGVRRCILGKSIAVTTAYGKEYKVSRELNHQLCKEMGQIHMELIDMRSRNPTGLQLQLYVGQDEYLTLQDTAGIVVHVHDQRVTPFPEDDGITIVPGKSTNLGVQQVL